MSGVVKCRQNILGILRKLNFLQEKYRKKYFRIKLINN